MAAMRYRIEPDMQYCPKCQDEYRPGVKECAACGVGLLSGEQMLELSAGQRGPTGGPATVITPEDELVDILKGKIINVKEIHSLLSRRGIPSLIAGDSSSCGKGCGGTDVRLQVRVTDLPDVMAIMAKEHVEATGLVDHDTSYADAIFDPDAGAATCPACGCTFSTANKSCPDCGLCF